MLTFDEPRLKNELAALTPQLRLAFAVARATRQLTVYEHTVANGPDPDPIRPRDMASRLWQKIRESDLGHDTWPAIRDELMDQTEAMVRATEDNPDATLLDLLAEDALASLIYAIRCLLTDDAQEAAWAARRDYESADQAAIKVLDIEPERYGEPATPAGQAQFLEHEFVQRTLRAQRTDLDLLKLGRLDDVHRRMHDYPAFTNDELARLASIVV